jgi:hypothetical protein
VSAQDVHSRGGVIRSTHLGGFVIRHSSIRVIAIAALALPAAAFGQNTSRPTFGVSAGASFPTSDFGDAVKSGYSIAGHVGVKPALFPIGVRLEGMYNRFDLKGVSSTSSTTPNATIWAGTANGVLMSASSPGMLRPYLIGGVGVYGLKTTNTESVTKFGVNGGVGLDLALSGIGTFIEARYHYVLTKDNSIVGTTNTGFVPVVVGVRF